MRALVNYTACFVALLVSHFAWSQYVFDSKKSEKLYQKFEELYEAADYEKILKSEKDFLSTFEAKQDTVTANVYASLGEAYLLWNGDVEQSQSFFLKELALRTKVQPGERQRNLLFNIARNYDELGQFDKSEGLLKELSVTDAKEFGKKSDEYFKSNYALLNHYITRYKYKEGLEVANEVRRYAEKNSYNEALVLRAYAELYNLSGELKKAEKNILLALDILKKTGYYPSLEYVYFMNTLAYVYSDMGKLAVVEEIYQNALSILDRLQGDYQEDAIAVKSNLAILYRDLGNYAQAEELLMEVLKFDEAYFGRESTTIGYSYYSLGLNSFYAQDYVSAEKYLLTAKDILAKAAGKENINYARTLNTLTSVYNKTNRFTEAKALEQASLEAHRKSVGESNPEFAWPTQVLGELYQRLGDFGRAETYYTQSLKIRAKALGTSHPLYARNTRLMAILQWQKNNMEEALTYYKQTFNNYFDQINAFFPVLSEEEKSKFYYNNLKPTFEQFNSFIIKNKSEDKQLIGMMYDYQLATKGLILYATSKVRESILNSGDSALIVEYDTWIGQKEMLAQLYSSSDLDPEVRSKRIDSLKAASDDLEGKLSKKSSVFSDNFASKNLTWRDVQAKLKPGEAAIEIIRFRDFVPDSAGRYTGEVFYAGLIVTKETVEAPELVIMRNGAEMEKKYLANYRNSIRYQVSETYSYNLFWKPLDNKLKGIKKIYFSPDGVYNQISIYTLRNPATKRYTIDEFEIQMVTNTKDLVKYSFENITTFDKPTYLYGYPNYNLGAVEKEIKSGKTVAEVVSDNPESRSVRGATRGVRGAEGEPAVDMEAFTRSLPRGIRGNLLRYMQSNSLLALLPGTQREVNLINELHKNQNMVAATVMGNEALEESVKSVKNPQTLHIATHGFFLEEEGGSETEGDKYVSNPLLRSGLIMAGANSFISTGDIGDGSKHPDDGILTAYEAMNMNLDQTELVVLSACETGLGEVQNGEGVFGLQRAFQVAGAKAIIMSMWTVDDDATQELMTTFYQNWLTTGDKHKAFISAQKQIKNKWIKPYYWGAFVMVGN